MRTLHRTGRIGARLDGQRLIHFPPSRCPNCHCGARATADSNTDILWPEEAPQADPQFAGWREGATAELSISSQGFHRAVALLFGGPLAGLFMLLFAAPRLPVWLTVGLSVGTLLLWRRFVLRYAPALQRQLAPQVRVP